MAGPFDRLAYAAAQTLRVGWYFGQWRLAQRLSRGAVPPPRRPVRGPGTRALLEDLRALMRRDWRNIEAGLYPMPDELLAPPGRALAEAGAFFLDLPAVNRRRRLNGQGEVARRPPPGTPRLPRYYLRNFHFQTDGYLSARSARLYDHQVEVLFGGGADAMRRQLLVPLQGHLRGRDPAQCRLLDIGCGTGRFLGFARAAHPALALTGIDLSPPYLAEARRRVPDANLLHAAAEAMPLAAGSVDVVTCVFLFHELPRPVRTKVAAEIARVLRPGGRLLFLDSLQSGDRPAYDGLLEHFPEAFHEPYYADYLRHDLTLLFEGAGLRKVDDDRVFMAKLLHFAKPAV